MHVLVLIFRMNISLGLIYYWWISVKLLPLLFPVKLDVNISGATTPFDAAAAFAGKTNDFAQLLEKLWPCLNEWELVGLIKVRAENGGPSTGQLERENSNKLQREHDPTLLFNLHLSVYKSSLYMQPWESCDNLTSICWLQAAVRLLQHPLGNIAQCFRK